jgi:hypothetical protein
VFPVRTYSTQNPPSQTFLPALKRNLTIYYWVKDFQYQNKIAIFFMESL